MRIGTICYSTRQGLGYLAKSFYDNGLVTDPVVMIHPSRPSNHDWFPEAPHIRSRNSDYSVLDPILDKVQAMLFFETPFNWQVLERCREKGVKSILIPMYEWTPETWPVKPDALICPSLLDLEIFKDEFHGRNCIFIPIPVETKHWKLRKKAERFLHNAGNIGHREHKGTRELLKSIKHVKSQDFRLTVRGQDTDLLRGIIDSENFSDPRVSIELGEIPYEQLWDDHDVYIAPEKFNGLSLPLQEAYAAGMPVMATNRYPHNTWLPISFLIKPQSFHFARVSNGCRRFKEAVVSPIEIAKRIDEVFGSNIEHCSYSGQRWSSNNTWEKLIPRYRRVINCIVEG